MLIFFFNIREIFFRSYSIKAYKEKFKQIFQETQPWVPQIPAVKPLNLEIHGKWNPQDVFPPGDEVDKWLKPVLNLGPRDFGVMESIDPGDPEDFDSDPIQEANQQRKAGDLSSAIKRLTEIVHWDVRCLDAHAHLGLIYFDNEPGKALEHYKTGTGIGLLSLENEFDGVLSWAVLENRPFLRCLQGLGLCYWRMDNFALANEAFTFLLFLDPPDHLGARMCLDDIQLGTPHKDVYDDADDEPVDQIGFPEFDYSPNKMHSILYSLFEPGCPIQLNLLNEKDCENSGMFNQLVYLLETIQQNEKITLTAKGNLPQKLVIDIFDKSFVKRDDPVFYRNKREQEIFDIHLTRIIADACKLIRKQKNKLFLTKEGKKYLKNKPGMLKLVFKTLATQVNWAYFDNWSSEQIGQLGFGYTLYLLSKYGNEEREQQFYADKYFKAFPALKAGVDQSEKNFGNLYLNSPFFYRTFENVLEAFSLVKLETKKKGILDPSHVRENDTIQKTELFDKLISVEYP